MLFMVCVSAFVPFVWVMVVGCGVSGWRVFQCRVAVVPASRRVPGVLACVVVGFGVWVACSCVVWLVVGACARVVGVGVGVSWLVCVLWRFRMLTCSGLFLVLFVLFVWLITVAWLFGVGWCVCLGSSCWWRVGCCFGVCVVSGGRLHVWLLLVGGCLAWCAFLGSCGLLGCCFVLLVCARGRVFVCGVCECWVCLAKVVVWVVGVLLGVACCLRGFVMWLLRVVWAWGLMWGCGCLRSVV